MFLLPTMRGTVRWCMRMFIVHETPLALVALRFLPCDSSSEKTYKFAQT